MKWVTHQAGALALALLFKLNPATTAGMILGAVLPDAVEQAVSFKNRRLFFAIHRGFFHWFGLYGLGLLLIAALPLNPQTSSLGLGLFLGALSHLALDALNPSGVPLLPLAQKPRLKMPLVSTGSAGEWLFLAGLLAVIVLGGSRLDGEWLANLQSLLKSLQKML